MNIIEHDVMAELLTANMQDGAVAVSLRHDMADPFAVRLVDEPRDLRQRTLAVSRRFGNV